MFRTPIPNDASEEEAARAVLQGNLRVALASLVAGALACAVALPTLELPTSAIATGLTVVGGMLVAVGGGLFALSVAPPSALVGWFADRLRSSGALDRREPGAPPLHTWTARGAAGIGALTLAWAVAVIFVLTL